MSYSVIGLIAQTLTQSFQALCVSKVILNLLLTHRVTMLVGIHIWHVGSATDEAHSNLQCRSFRLHLVVLSL